MKKILSLVVAFFIGITGASAEDTASEAKAKLIDYINQTKAQEFVHTLVQLKLKEIELKTAGADEKELKPLREQQTAINEELVKLVVLPFQMAATDLEKQIGELKKVANPENPRILQLTQALEVCNDHIESSRKLLMEVPSKAPELGK